MAAGKGKIEIVVDTNHGESYYIAARYSVVDITGIPKSRPFGSNPAKANWTHSFKPTG